MWNEVEASKLKEGDLIYTEGTTAFIREIAVDGGEVKLKVDRDTNCHPLMHTEDIMEVKYCFDDKVKLFVSDGKELAFRFGSSEKTDDKAHKGESITVDLDKGKIFKKKARKAK